MFVINTRPTHKNKGSIINKKQCALVVAFPIALCAVTEEVEHCWCRTETKLSVAETSVCCATVTFDRERTIWLNRMYSEPNVTGKLQLNYQSFYMLELQKKNGKPGFVYEVSLLQKCLHLVEKLFSYKSKQKGKLSYPHEVNFYQDHEALSAPKLVVVYTNTCSSSVIVGLTSSWLVKCVAPFSQVLRLFIGSNYIITSI